jgi:multicomponent Na+:H+ antiporter subunit G
MSEIIGTIFIAAGLVFNIAGCIGLIRLPDVYSRLQATTKSITLGTCIILLGTFIMKGTTATGIKSLLCIMFLLLTAPAAAHAIARAADAAGAKHKESL